MKGLSSPMRSKPDVANEDPTDVRGSGPPPHSNQLRDPLLSPDPLSTTLEPVVPTSPGGPPAAWMLLASVPPADRTPEVERSGPRRNCATCGTLFQGRPDKRYCSDACRTRASRERRAQEVADTIARFDRVGEGWTVKNSALPRESAANEDPADVRGSQSPHHSNQTGDPGSLRGLDPLPRAALPQAVLLTVDEVAAISANESEGHLLDGRTWSTPWREAGRPSCAVL